MVSADALKPGPFTIIKVCLVCVKNFLTRYGNFSTSMGSFSFFHINWLKLLSRLVTVFSRETTFTDVYVCQRCTKNCMLI
ncbi:hypothetical protein AMTRI_Chr02g264410 [Amborella trichopoda]